MIFSAIISHKYFFYKTDKLTFVLKLLYLLGYRNSDIQVLRGYLQNAKVGFHR